MYRARDPRLGHEVAIKVLSVACVADRRPTSTVRAGGPRDLNAYITDPQAFIRGNRTAFAGISYQAERADLMTYLAATTRR